MVKCWLIAARLAETEDSFNRKTRRLPAKRRTTEASGPSPISGWFWCVRSNHAKNVSVDPPHKVLAFDTWPYGQKSVFVLSTRPLAPTPAGALVERMSGAPAEIVSQLAARGIQHAYVDGGITIQRFLQAGLIQRLIITRVPVLIGTGIPLFGALPRDIVLKHVGTRQCASGLVQSEYVVAA